jgi:hypothetical protein
MTMHGPRMITALAACGIATALASGAAAGEPNFTLGFERLITDKVIAVPKESGTGPVWVGPTQAVPSPSGPPVAIPPHHTGAQPDRAVAAFLSNIAEREARDLADRARILSTYPHDLPASPPLNLNSAKESFGRYVANVGPALDALNSSILAEPDPETVKEMLLSGLLGSGAKTTARPEVTGRPDQGLPEGAYAPARLASANARLAVERVIAELAERIQDLDPVMKPARSLDPDHLDGGDHGVVPIYVYAAMERLANDIKSAAEAAVDAPTTPWADFPFYADGLISPAVPEELPSGAISAIYHGRLAGAFDNGTAIGADIALDVYFDQQIFGGSIAFEGGELPVNGQWRGPDQISGYFEGSALGGEVTGNLNGAFYGANVEEIGGSWALEVTAGPTGGRTASGEFAAKR